MSKELEDQIAKSLKIRDNDGNTVLHYIVQTDNVDFAKNLITAGSNVNEKNNEGDPPLAMAVCANKLEMVEILLKSGAIYRNGYFKDKKGPLFIAAQYGCPEIVQLFIELGVDVNARAEYLQTPLHCVFTSENEQKSEDYCKIIKMLLDADADINAIDMHGKTPLLNSLAFGFSEGFELLISMGADICIEGKMNFMLLYETLETDNLYLLKRLIELGYDVNMTNDEGESILHIAASFSQIETLKFLLSKGALINANCDKGFNPLYTMIDYSIYTYEDIISTTNDLDRCLEEGSNREIHIEHLQTLDLLLKHGANVNHMANDGLTPFDFVLQYYDSMPSNFVRILLKYGAKFDFADSSVVEVMNSSNGSKFPHLLLRHTALFEAQNRTDGPANFDLDRLNEKSRKDYARCRDELELMKSTKVDNTTVSFFDILIKKDIGPYTRNESIRNVFEATNVFKSFPIYSDLLCERFSEETEYQTLVQEATVGLGYVLNWDCDSTHLPLSTVIRYLDKTDLNNLALI